MALRAILVFLFVWLGCSPVFSAIVILDGLEDAGDAAGNEKLENLNENLLSLPDTAFGFQQAVEDWQRSGIGEQGQRWQTQDDLMKLAFLLDEARKAFEAGQFNESLLLLEQAEQRNPRHPVVELALADNLLKLERYEDALKWVRAAQRDGAKPGVTTFYKALCAEGIGDFDEAGTLYEEVIDDESAILKQQAFLATLRLRVKSDDSFEQAEQTLLGILKRREDQAVVLDALIALSLRAENYPKASKYTNELLSLDSESLSGHLGLLKVKRAMAKEGDRLDKEFTAFIKQFPARPEGYLYLADALVRDGKGKSAIRLLEAAAPKVTQKKTIVHAMARLYYNEDRWEDGLRLNILLLENDPTDLMLWQDYLAALTRKFSEGDAPALKEFPEDDPEAGRKHIALAYESAAQTNYPIAARHFIKALYKGEKSVGNFNDLGCVVLPLLGSDVAAPFFRMALFGAPNYREAAANLQASQAMSNSRKRQEAIEKLRAQSGGAGNAAERENRMGELQGEEGNVKAAQGHFKKASELDPTFSKAYLNLARSLFLAGDLDGALRQAELAVLHRGEWAEPLFREGWLILKKEQVTEKEQLKLVSYENIMLRDDLPYIQAHGKLLRAERYARFKGLAVALIKARDCAAFAHQNGFEELHQMAQALIRPLEAKE